VEEEEQQTCLWESPLFRDVPIDQIVAVRSEQNASIHLTSSGGIAFKYAPVLQYSTWS
jgi:hypothetical protein